ncbi:hypothetical protein QJS10_CPB18g00533 [Acorus calamus]|uniref:Uncharacterized protein n=1 Tax=Acorus calamus TaxID=4465 RepID=A0AAV9CLG2_ACOCL|nr:hypothetical protein QJS10_CPB18g00533 [Acorus calamus]
MKAIAGEDGRAWLRTVGRGRREARTASGGGDDAWGCRWFAGVDEGDHRGSRGRTAAKAKDGG